MAHSTPEYFSKHQTHRNKSRLGNPHYPGTETHHPKPQTVRNILAYSKALEVKPSDSVSHITLVLN